MQGLFASTPHRDGLGYELGYVDSAGTPSHGVSYQRSYRSPHLSAWVDLVLEGGEHDAAAAVKLLGEYPVYRTRSLSAARSWLRQTARGLRRTGLLASSGARRLRANGLGSFLNAAAGDEIAHWYLKPPGDIRSSYALEVAANEYTCQGLEAC
jgi:Uncharacterized conserved protein (DUF2075)